MSLPEVINDPTIQQLQQKSAEAQADYQEQRQHRLDTNPFVIAAAAHIDEINRQIQSLAQSIRDSIQNRYQVARRQEADLSQSVGHLESQTLTDQGKGAKYNALKRNADSDRQLYEALLQRSNSLATSSAVIPEAFSIVDRAAPPTAPVSPKPLLWSAAGAAIAFLLGAALILISGLRDNRVHSPEVVDSDLHLRVLGVLRVSAILPRPSWIRHHRLPRRIILFAHRWSSSPPLGRIAFCSPAAPKAKARAPRPMALPVISLAGVSTRS